jgi:putative phosphoesterase
MRVAALYDIHGNLPALEAVVAELDADLVVVGGDVASGPFPAETLALLRSVPMEVRFVRGNADRVLDLDEILDAHRSARLWVAERLGEEDVRFLRELPLDVVVEDVRFCHGAPGSDTEPITRVTSDERLRRLLRGVEERMVVCGHTHVQFDRSVASVRVFNAGSVGFPYEAEPGAYWLELAPEPVFHRTEYDVEKAIARIRATGHPNADWAEQLAMRDPERPQRMSEIIEGRAT